MATEAEQRETMIAAARARIATAERDLARAASEHEADELRRVIEDSLDTLAALGAER